MKLLLELLSLVEDTRADVESLLYRAIKKITGKRVTIRKRGSFLVDFVIDGSHDRNGADDFEVHRIVTELKKDSSLPFTVEETFKSKHIGISTGFNVFLKAAGDKKGHQLFHVEIKKQPITRDSADGNPRVDYEIVRLPPDTGNGIKNELLLVHHVSRFLESANKPITIVFQDHRGKTLRVENVTRVKHVGSQNRKADVELITADNHAVKISIKQQNFLEIDAGLNLTRQHRDKIFFHIQAAWDDGEINFDESERLSRNKSTEIAIKLSEQNARTAYLGAGGDKVDAVIIETFLNRDFNGRDQELQIRCDVIIQDVADIPDRLYPYALISSNFNRNELNLIGKLYLSVVPRFQLQPNQRHDSPHPRTLVVKETL